MRWGWGPPRGGRAGDYNPWFLPPRRRRNALLTPWRWRYEFGLVLGAPVGFRELADVTHPIAATSLVLVVGVVGMIWPAGRRVLADRVRCVLVQHRIRVGMVQSGVLSWSGWLPAILWTTPLDGDVRVYLWCPAGVDVNAFHSNRSRLAAACWASDVVVTCHPRYSHILVLLVVAGLGRRGIAADPPSRRSDGLG
jgi:hypothetical protein